MHCKIRRFSGEGAVRDETGGLCFVEHQQFDVTLDTLTRPLSPSLVFTAFTPLYYIHLSYRLRESVRAQPLSFIPLTRLDVGTSGRSV